MKNYFFQISVGQQTFIFFQISLMLTLKQLSRNCRRNARGCPPPHSPSCHTPQISQTPSQTPKLQQMFKFLCFKLIFLKDFSIQKSPPHPLPAILDGLRKINGHNRPISTIQNWFGTNFPLPPAPKNGSADANEKF